MSRQVKKGDYYFANITRVSASTVERNTFEIEFENADTRLTIILDAYLLKYLAQALWRVITQWQKWLDEGIQALRG